MNRIFEWLKKNNDHTPSAVYDRTGRLRINNVKNEVNGNTHNVVLRLVEGYRFELESIDPPLQNVGILGNLDYVCNICRTQNYAVPISHIAERETSTCSKCGSGLRVRSIINALAIKLIGRSLAIQDFPENKEILGIGLSDWIGYAQPLAEKFNYVNTFLYEDPRLDITSHPAEWNNKFDFIISSDVFEHVKPPAQLAFNNAFSLLKSGGVLAFTVPYQKLGETTEHFPDLYDFKIIEHHGKRFLYNKTVNGDEQIFDSLIFHGGDGLTLEMRRYSEPDLLKMLKNAGFINTKVHKENYLEFGIFHSNDWSLPITAEKP